jgi:rubrerythrin
MAAGLSLDDLFRIAERVENRGAQFYRLVAESCADSAGQKIFEGLAQMEAEHEEVFAGIRKHVLKLEGQRGLAPQAGARFRIVFDVVLGGLMKDLQGRFRGKTSSGDILREAIAFEKDTIVFLAELGNTIDDPADRKKIQLILREELAHVFTLSAQLVGEGPRRGPSATAQATA